MATVKLNFPQTPSEQAYQAIRAVFSRLVDKVQTENIADHLFSNESITEKDFAFAIDEEKSPKVRARKIVYAVMMKVKSNYKHFEVLCEALESCELSDCSMMLKDNIKELQKNQIATENDHLKILKNQLSVIQKGLYESDENIEAKHEIMKEFIVTFIKNSSETLKQSETSNHLHRLCYEEMLIPAKLYDWTFEILHTLYQTKEDSSDTTAADDFNKLTLDESPSYSFSLAEEVNQCLLLCEVVSSCNYDDYTSFLNQQLHSFDEVSFSLKPPNFLNYDLPPYVIARNNSTNTMYVAFLSNPDLSSWTKQMKFTLFNERITNQCECIPVRFFVEQIQNGYKIIFTGFSTGGLLALSVYASVWHQNCLSPNNLQQCVHCVTFGVPLVPFESFDSWFNENDEIKQNHHLYIMKEDVIPRLLQCCKEDKKEAQHNSLEFSDKINIVVIKLLTDSTLKKESQPAIDISMLTNLLQDKQQVIQLPEAKIYGTCQYIYHDSSTGALTVSQLAPKAAVEVLRLPTAEELNHSHNLITTHSLSKYKRSLNQLYSSQSQAAHYSSKVIQEIPILKPDAKSINFYRHGEEVALVFEGTNLWFCSHIKITNKGRSRLINALESPPTCHSIHFNYTPKNEDDLLINKKEDVIDVLFYSHFTKSIRKKLPAYQIGEYHISHRQRQLAKCTPMEIIELSFLSALLEKTSKDDSPSHRFKTICQFLENSVKIVPIESICYAIGAGSNENSWKCAKAMTSNKMINPVSFLLPNYLTVAINKLLVIEPDHLQDFAPHMQFDDWLNFFMNVFGDLMSSCIPNATGRTYSDVTKGKKPSTQINYESVFKTIVEMRNQAILSIDKKLKQGNLNFISNRNIQDFYPTTDDESSPFDLHSPISVLKVGRKSLSELHQNLQEGIFQLLAEGEESKTLHNEEMISTIDDILNDDLAICVSILGGFMQEQITIPLVDSPKHTAHILQTSKPPPAVGVWGLFSLQMIDFENMLRSKKGKALYVKVDKYIRSFFSKGTSSLPDEMYTGKLQFLMHCLNNSVSSSQEYISYSLEMQLVELCKKQNIQSTTTVRDLISKWNSIFQETLMFHVHEPFRPLVARWILWCLNIHNLREELASHTTVAIAGLSNSGKSCLVKTLFKQKIVSGTMNLHRTTVPFLYNLDGSVDGLSVIDFPGADDMDDTVVKLSEILLKLSQLVVLVIDYRRRYTDSAKTWIDILRNADVPVLVCLTYGDKLYANTFMDVSNDQAKRFLHQELLEICTKLNPSRSWKVDLFSFCQDTDSSLNNDKGRQKLKDVGILSCNDVGEWIENELRTYMKEEELAERLKSFRTSGASKGRKFPGVSTVKEVPPIRSLTYYGETQFLITSKGIDFAWDGYGLKIKVPPNAISDSLTEVYVKTISSGHYSLPDNTVLVSPLFWLYSPKKFLKYVDLQIEHCANSAALKDNFLSFIHGRCDQKNLPYSFKIRKEGNFSSNSREGVIPLKSFCIMGIISQLSAFYPALPSAPNDKPKSFDPSIYVVKVFAKCIEPKICKFDFIFIKDLTSFHTRISEEYKGWMHDVQEHFEMGDSNSDVISLEIKASDFIGWKCIKKNSCEIARRMLEKCQPDNNLLKCCLEVRWQYPGDPLPVESCVEINGPSITPKLTLTLPIISGHSKATMMETAVEINPPEYPLTSSNAVKILRDSKFQFFTFFWNLATELDVEIDTKNRLHETLKANGNELMATEVAVDFWIRNSDSANWDKFVEAIRKCDVKVADDVKAKLIHL